MIKRFGIALVTLFLIGWPLLAQFTAPGEQRLLQPLFLLPSLLISGALLLSFGGTLRPGREPLVAAIARSVHGPLSPKVARYTWRVTQMWTVLFALLLIELSALAWFAPLPISALAVNTLNFALLAAVFIAEFFCRRLFLPEVDHIGFGEYIRVLRRLNFLKIGRP